MYSAGSFSQAAASRISQLCARPADPATRPRDWYVGARSGWRVAVLLSRTRENSTLAQRADNLANGRAFRSGGDSAGDGAELAAPRYPGRSRRAPISSGARYASILSVRRNALITLGHLRSRGRKAAWAGNGARFGRVCIFRTRAITRRRPYVQNVRGCQ